MRFLTPYISLLFLVQHLSAQNYQEAYVTSLQNFIEVSELVDSSKFPAYAKNEFFQEDLKNEIDLLIQKQFGARFVIFSSLDGIEIKYGHFPKKKAKSDDVPKRIGTLFLTIRTTLQLDFQSYEENVYSITTELSAYNYESQKIYSYSNKIPFVVLESETISGKVEMSAEDFYDFYFDGIRAAFEGKEKKLEKRYIYKPTTADYADFLPNAAKYYLKNTNNLYSIGKSIADQTKIMEYDYAFWKSLQDNSYNYSNPYRNQYAKAGFDFENAFAKKKYTIRLGGYQETSPTEIVTEIYQDKNLIGKFQYLPTDEMNGKFLDENYSFKWSAVNRVCEYYRENELLVLIKEFPDYKVLYFSNSLKETYLGDFFTLMFLYDFSLLVKDSYALANY